MLRVLEVDPSIVKESMLGVVAGDTVIVFAEEVTVAPVLLSVNVCVI